MDYFLATMETWRSTIQITGLTMFVASSAFLSLSAARYFSPECRNKALTYLELGSKNRAAVSSKEIYSNLKDCGFIVSVKGDDLTVKRSGLHLDPSCRLAYLIHDLKGEIKMQSERTHQKNKQQGDQS